MCLNQKSHQAQTSGGMCHERICCQFPRESFSCPTRPGDLGASHAAASLTALVERIPEGWTLVTYEGRRYGLTRTTRVHGRSISVSAEELGGPDLISTNVYRTRKAEHLRPCEMPEAKVLAFLLGWTPA